MNLANLQICFIARAKYRKSKSFRTAPSFSAPPQSTYLRFYIQAALCTEYAEYGLL